MCGYMAPESGTDLVDEEEGGTRSAVQQRAAHTREYLLLACAAHTYLCRYTPSCSPSPSLLNPTPSPLRRYATLVAFLWGMARWSCASQRSLLACCLAVVLLASLLRATPARAVPDREPFHSPGRPDDDGSSVGLVVPPSHGAWP